MNLEPCSPLDDLRAEARVSRVLINPEEKVRTGGNKFQVLVRLFRIVGSTYCSQRLDR